MPNANATIEASKQMHKEAKIKRKGTRRDEKLAEGCKYVAKGSEAEPKGSRTERSGSQKESKGRPKGSPKGAKSETAICPKIDLRKSRKKDAPRSPLKSPKLDLLVFYSVFKRAKKREERRTPRHKCGFGCNF